MGVLQGELSKLLKWGERQIDRDEAQVSKAVGDHHGRCERRSDWSEAISPVLRRRGSCAQGVSSLETGETFSRI